MKQKIISIENMNHSNNITPPLWPLKLLRFFVKKEYAEEIEGDMEEIFYDNIEQHSIRKAKRIYTWETLKLLRPALIKNLKAFQSFNQFNMFGNYFKTSSRSLMKNPTSSFINIFGLSMAVGICVLWYGFAQYVNDIDQFHEHKNEVYLVTFFADREGKEQQFGTTPTPLGEMLQQDYPQIKKICRINDRPVVIKYNDHVFHERIRYVEPEFLQLFTFPLKWGSANSLIDINSIVLSEEMSIKYFGEENPLGKSIKVIFSESNSKEFAVAGVAKKFPEANAIDFDFLIHFDNQKISNPAYNTSDWSSYVNATLIQVDNPTDIALIQQGMNKYKLLQNEKHSEQAISNFGFVSLAELYKKSMDIRDGICPPYYESNAKAVIILGVITLFLLTLACFNYINIAIVTAAKRLKEIGVRKVIGATRSKVITQFLSENIFVTSFALIFGLAIGMFIFIPGFEQINGFSMDFTLAHRNLWIFLVAVLFITGMISGLYPALYISKFEVVNILKGSSKFGKQNPLNKILLGFQLILACILITCAVMFTQNTDYVAKRYWGYNQNDALYAEVHNQLAYEQLNAAMAQSPNVTSIAGSVNHIGKNHATTIIKLPPNKEYEVQQLAVDANYFSTMQLTLIKGRAFNPQPEADKQNIIINEEFVKSLNWQEAIGQQIKIDSMRYEVIGVVKNFHSYSFDSKMLPTIFTVANKADYRFISLRVRSGSERETYAALQAQWNKLFPEIPFQGSYQEDVWGNFFVRIKNHGRFWQAIALITILIAGLGLYGLVTLNVTGRTKEFSIRKVLGAQTNHIATGILRQYIILFAVSLLIGVPVSYSLVKFLFDIAYDYHVPMNYLSITLAVSMLIFVLLFVVFTQVSKVAKASPVNGLKVE
jgi:putative ABC transport system permease protein